MWYTWNLEKALAPHSSTLAWKIPWTEEPGRLQSMGSQRVGHDWVTLLSLSCTGEGNGNPLQCSCLENPRDERGWWATVYGVAQSRTQLKRLSSSSSIPEINTLLSVNFTSINKTKSKIQTPPKKKHFAQAWATVSTQNMVEVVIAMIVMLALILILMLVKIQY